MTTMPRHFQIMTSVENTELLTSLEINEKKRHIGGSTLGSIKEDGKWRRRTWQLLAVLSANVVNLALGSAESWTSPALPYLKKNNTEFRIQGNEGSWVASLLSIGEIFGYLLYPLLIDRIGRKYSLIIFAIPQIISWTLIYLAKNVIFLYLARFIGGTGLGGGYAITILYLGEISEKKFRGMFVTTSKVIRIMGSIMALSCGAFVSYDTMNLILLSVPLIFLATFIFMPESPYFYLYRDREKEAVDSLSKFRGTKDSTLLEEDIKRMKDGIIESKQLKQNAFKMVFQNRRHRKAFLIVVTLQAAVAFSGSKAITAYFQDIFSYSGISIPPENAALALESLAFIFIIPLVFLVDKIGRRFTILLSGLACATSLGTVGLFFFLKDYQQIDTSSISWISLVALGIFKVSSICLYSIPAVLSSELFSMQIKSSAVSFIFIIKEFMMFIVKLNFERSVNAFGIYGVFWIYTVACFVLSLTGFFITPETKGKNLEEIQLLLDS